MATKQLSQLEYLECLSGTATYLPLFDTIFTSEAAVIYILRGKAFRTSLRDLQKGESSGDSLVFKEIEMSNFALISDGLYATPERLIECVVAGDELIYCNSGELYSTNIKNNNSIKIQTPISPYSQISLTASLIILSSSNARDYLLLDPYTGEVAHVVLSAQELDLGSFTTEGIIRLSENTFGFFALGPEESAPQSCFGIVRISQKFKLSLIFLSQNELFIISPNLERRAIFAYSARFGLLFVGHTDCDQVVLYHFIGDFGSPVLLPDSCNLNCSLGKEGESTFLRGLILTEVESAESSVRFDLSIIQNDGMCRTHMLRFRLDSALFQKLDTFDQAFPEHGVFSVFLTSILSLESANRPGHNLDVNISRLHTNRLFDSPQCDYTGLMNSLAIPRLSRVSNPDDILTCLHAGILREIETARQLIIMQDDSDTPVTALNFFAALRQARTFSALLGDFQKRVTNRDLEFS
jgi:hypothetical protein